MMFRIRASINVKPGPSQIDISFRTRCRSIVDYQTRLVFEWNDGIDVINGSGSIGPGVTPIPRNVHDHSIFCPRRSRDTNAVERQMNVIGNAVGTERNHIVTLNQILWIRCRNCLPRLAAIEGDVVITSGAWLRWKSRLERRGDYVVRVLWIDRNRDFTRINRRRLSD